MQTTETQGNSGAVPSLEEIREAAKAKDHATYDGYTLKAEYQNDGKPSSYEWVKTEPNRATYWACADGKPLPLFAITTGTCIATTEDALHMAGFKAVYCTFASRDKEQPAVWQRWQSKWIKRTGAANRWDASVSVRQ